jgi:hypothetical protein
MPRPARKKKLSLKERLMLRLMRLLGHKQNASGNNMSQR